MPDSSPQLDEADNIAGTQDKISQKKDCKKLEGNQLNY